MSITSKYYNTYDIVSKLLLFVILLHVTACVNYMIARQQGSGAVYAKAGPDRYTWSIYITFALLLGDAGLGILDIDAPKNLQLLFGVGVMVPGHLPAMANCVA